MEPEARVDSFVLRFVHQVAADPHQPDAGWYSIIRHVQSDTERHLTRWEDIVAFIAQYITLDKAPEHE